MKNLILIRHAKSSWDAPLRDFERPITVEGKAKAIRVAQAGRAIIPNDSVIWSSSANRAASTARIFLHQWGQDVDRIYYREDLYTFESDKLEHLVRSCPDSCNHLILFGHNNAITDFVNNFGDIFIDNVPTAGLVSLIFEADSWQTIQNGKTVKILFPRDC